jgi:hypothetical protein
MTGGNVTDKHVFWWRLHQITQELDGELKQFIVQDSRGKLIKRIVIEYEENND